jgi:predicted transposase YbfD/YdcC
MPGSGVPAGGPGADERVGPVLMQVRLDGKTVRGAKDAEGNQRHLLAALVGSTASRAVIAAQTEVGAKTNEVPMAQAVLEGIELTDTVLTADALHTVKATARYVHQRGGQFVLPVKENRRALFDALNALPWHEVPITHSGTERGHGRISTRTIRVLPAPKDLPFPHVNQVWLIERYVSDLRGGAVSAVAALGVASLPRGRGQPRRAGRIRARPVGHRVTTLDPRHPVSRRQIPGQNPIRTQNHGHATQSGDRSPPPSRTHRHHRGHPMGQPQHDQTIRHPRTHHMILKRP